MMKQNENSNGFSSVTRTSGLTRTKGHGKKNQILLAVIPIHNKIVASGAYIDNGTFHRCLVFQLSLVITYLVPVKRLVSEPSGRRLSLEAYFSVCVELVIFYI